MLRNVKVILGNTRLNAQKCLEILRYLEILESLKRGDQHCTSNK